jgi:hypothetical protein
VSFEGLRHEPDVSVGDWIAARLRGFGGRVNRVVPDGFEAYARILHPAENERGQATAWAEVCRTTGRVTHALMQWNSIAGVVQHSSTEGRWPRRRPVSWQTSEWPGSEPMQGDVPPALLSDVRDVLAGFTPDDVDCYHALWEGWGWLHDGGWGFMLAVDAQGRPARVPPSPAGLPAEVMAGPRMRLPGRDHLVFRGPLRAALRMGHQVTEDWFSPHSPSLLWPPDHSWCLASEIDFDSTLVGGPQALVDALLSAPGLEAWSVDAADDLTHDGDTVNR